MFAQSSLQFFYERLIKPNQMYCQSHLQATLRGKKARPQVNFNVSLTNIWRKLSHCCRSLAHVWMPLGGFGQADELFLHCWSPWLCMTYASPFGTDESAWDKQWWNLRPSPMVREWQVTLKTGYFLGFTVNFVFKLVLKSLQDWQHFRLRPHGIGCFQRWCLHCDKVRQDIPFTSLFTDLWSLKQKTEDSKGHGSFVVLT